MTSPTQTINKAMCVATRSQFLGFRQIVGLEIHFRMVCLYLSGRFVPQPGAQQGSHGSSLSNTRIDIGWLGCQSGDVSSYTPYWSLIGLVGTWLRRGAVRGGAENGSYVSQGVYRVYALRLIELFVTVVSELGACHSALRIRHFAMEFIPHSRFVRHSEREASCF